MTSSSLSFYPDLCVFFCGGKNCECLSLLSLYVFCFIYSFCFILFCKLKAASDPLGGSVEYESHTKIGSCNRPSLFATISWVFGAWDLHFKAAGNLWSRYSFSKTRANLGVKWKLLNVSVGAEAYVFSALVNVCFLTGHGFIWLIYLRSCSEHAEQQY